MRTCRHLAGVARAGLCDRRPNGRARFALGRGQAQIIPSAHSMLLERAVHKAYTGNYVVRRSSARRTEITITRTKGRLAAALAVFGNCREP
jgi:hypothetical protein